MAKLAQRGRVVGNADMTIVAQSPRMGPHIGQMKAHIAADLHIDTNAVNVNAITTERMGYTGSEEGIAAHAVALIITAA